MSPDGTRITRVSNGTGRCTCAYFLSDNRILFSSTHHYGSAPPPRPEPPGGGYAWPVFREYDIFLLDPYENALTQLTDSPGYDAEATVHWPTDTIVFTSYREGDIDLYLMRADGREVRRLTRRLGYEGGAVISPDGRRVVFRAYYPETDEEAEAYRSLLGMNLVQPPHLELYVMDIDGTNVRQLTSNGGVNFAPFWHPDGERIIFMSNLHEVGRHEYDLYMIRADGTGLERITTAPGFDGFPVFSPDARHLLWISKRADPHGRDMDVYLAEWVD
jgi:Tol biopolymer transport system component